MMFLVFWDSPNQPSPQYGLREFAEADAAITFVYEKWSAYNSDPDFVCRVIRGGKSFTPTIQRVVEISFDVNEMKRFVKS